MSTQDEILKTLKALLAGQERNNQRRGRGTPSPLSDSPSTTLDPNSDVDDQIAKQLQKQQSQEYILELNKELAEVKKKISTYDSSQVREARLLSAEKKKEHENLLGARDLARQAVEIEQEKLKAMAGAAPQQIALQEAILKHQKDVYDVEDQKVKKLEEEVKFLDKSRELLGEVEDHTNNILGLVGLSSRAYENSFYAKAEELGRGNIFQGLASQLGEMANTIGQSVRPSNLLAQATQSLRDNTLKMIGMQNTAFASFNKATSAGGKYNDLISETRETNTEFNVTIQESGAAMASLHKNFRAFTELGGEARATAAALTVQFDSLGVSSDTTSGLMSDLFHGLRQDVDTASATMMGLSGAADALGINQAEMMSEFKASMPTLAAYGDNAVEVFKGVAAASKATGIEMNKLIGLVSQFDTFQGAADAVSGLNAILGGPYLNSLEMVNATEDERIRLLVGSMEATGMAFGSLAKYEQKAIMAKLGINDLAEANRLLNTTTAELDANAAKAETGMMSPERMEELSKSAADFQEKLDALFQQFTVMVGPTVEVLNIILNGFLSLSDMLGGWLAPTLMATLILFTAIEKGMRLASGGSLLWTAITAKYAAVRAWANTQDASAILMYPLKAAGRALLTALQWAAVAVIYVLLAAQWLLVTAYNSTIVTMLRNIAVRGTMAAINAVVTVGTWLLTAAMWALGAASTFAGGPIALIVGLLLALGVALLVSLHSPPLYIGLGILVGLVVGLGAAMYFAGPAMSIAAGAMLAFGKGAAMAGVGMLAAAGGAAVLALAVVVLAVSFATMAVSLAVAAVGIALLSAGLFLMAISAGIAGPSLIFFAVGLGVLNLALLGFAATAWITLPVLFGIGAALLMVGVGAALVAVSFSSLNPTVLGQTATEQERIAAAVGMISTLSMLELGFAMSMISDSAGAAAPLRAAAELATATAAMTPEAAESTEKMMNAVVNVIQAADTGAGLKFGDQITEILDSVKDIVSAGQSKGGSQKEIKLYMDRNGRKEFAKGIIDDLSPEMGKKLSISKGPQISG